MRHLDELSVRLGFRVYLACIGTKDPKAADILKDEKVQQTVEEIINHYNQMHYEEHPTTTDPVPESEEPLPTTKRHEDTYG